MSAAPNPDELEVAPGFEKSNLQGSIFESASEAELLEALEKAFDYRGDVTLKLNNGCALEGYIFDRTIKSTLADSIVRLYPKGENRKVAIDCSTITGLTFSGRDTAAGKSFDAWVKKYWERKAAGEQNIELIPEGLE